MDQIEQVIFTSAETDRASGYHVVASSPAACDADLRELAAWGPSHDALLEPAPHVQSLNFHPLPSGAYCVGRTTPAGREYSDRGGWRLYTQCLIVPPSVLARFANNPFALLQAVVANGALRVCEKIPSRLEPLLVPGRAAVVDTELLARLAGNPGPEWMATVVQAAIDSVTIAIAGGLPSEHVIAGLINCLPPPCRTEFSFSTGLRFSSRRPFRVVALCGDHNEQRRIERLYNLAVLDLSGRPPAEFAPIESWPRFIHRVLRSGRLTFLASRLARNRHELSSEDLQVFGLEMLEQLEATNIESDAAETAAAQESPSGDLAAAAEADDCQARPANPGPRSEPRAKPLAPPARVRRLSAAHGPRPSGGSSLPAPERAPRPPSQQLAPGNPEVMEKLRHLDELVHAAVGGDEETVAQLRRLWPGLREELDEPALSESREQYLSYALALWAASARPDGSRNADCAAQLLDVLCILFE